ncbi:MAG: hypothetical protein E6G34_06800 [Actinobacteria bacterium]|nr:MAG: hypothetical protein E6G34_06800 [Actinomycetota bacterium]
MSPATIPTTLPAGYDPSGAQPTPEHDREPARRPVANASAVPCEVIDKLVVHIAGEDERASIEDLATRTGSNTPTGALMVGAVDGTPLAVVSMTSGEMVSEPTPAGAAVAAVVRYTVSRLGRRSSLATAAGASR